MIRGHSLTRGCRGLGQRLHAGSMVLFWFLRPPARKANLKSWHNRFKYLKQLCESLLIKVALARTPYGAFVDTRLKQQEQVLEIHESSPSSFSEHLNHQKWDKTEWQGAVLGIPCHVAQQWIEPSRCRPDHESKDPEVACHSDPPLRRPIVSLSPSTITIQRLYAVFKYNAECLSAEKGEGTRASRRDTASYIGYGVHYARYHKG